MTGSDDASSSSSSASESVVSPPSASAATGRVGSSILSSHGGSSEIEDFGPELEVEVPIRRSSVDEAQSSGPGVAVSATQLATSSAAQVLSRISGPIGAARIGAGICARAAATLGPRLGKASEMLKMRPIESMDHWSALARRTRRANMRSASPSPSWRSRAVNDGNDSLDERRRSSSARAGGVSSSYDANASARSRLRYRNGLRDTSESRGDRHPLLVELSVPTGVRWHIGPTLRSAALHVNQECCSPVLVGGDRFRQVFERRWTGASLKSCILVSSAIPTVMP